MRSRISSTSSFSRRSTHQRLLTSGLGPRSPTRAATYHQGTSVGDKRQGGGTTAQLWLRGVEHLFVQRIEVLESVPIDPHAIQTAMLRILLKVS
jgi:hypothetical protein